MGLFTQCVKPVFILSFLNQLCGCHHIPVLLHLCPAHLCHIPQGLLWVCTKNHTKYTEYFIVALQTVDPVSSFVSLLLSSFPQLRAQDPVLLQVTGG